MKTPILLVAAENSAENYASRVVDTFRKQAPDVHFFGIGGDRLAQAGMEITVHNRTLSIVGVFEIIAHLRHISQVMRQIVAEARSRGAKAALLVDYPDFNLRLAKTLTRAGISVYYFISPTVWAWRYGRVKQIRRVVRHLFTIFPFESPIYERERIPFTYVGHPVLQLMQERRAAQDSRLLQSIAANDTVVLVLPGSRPAEVRALLPIMIGAIDKLRRDFPALRPIIQQARQIDFTPYTQILAQHGLEVIDQEQGYSILPRANAIMTTCGTANLEAALTGIPFVAIYRVHPLSYFFGRRFVKIDRFSIVNILAKAEIIPELIQEHATAEALYQQTKDLLTNGARRAEMLRQFATIRALLNGHGAPEETIFQHMRNDLQI